ncbi:GNAT family protein [Microbacterium sp. APC 3898]|uniref:GNAT family protein n=1 Tax=Planococcus notacanthi TaxID=3035188 RepID=A0ABT7ZJF5_9BACL|nr:MULTISPECIES: GNAT family protein [Terrabacteria group]MBF6634888.1 GNAT family N-acetyltransferase [Planococcus sp. (in: firmicutes)]MDN3427268.1 GNAT family protein [Planococcus sp. APC 4016]MDN3499549.1 GNAT family protein [Microbacterium sp. APC 3898]
MDFPQLETERLLLNRIEERDAERFFDIMSRDEVTIYCGMDSLVHSEEAVEMIRSFQTSFNLKRGMRWAIRLKETGDFIGTIGLNNLYLGSKKAEIGYELHPDYWRQGFTQEAIRGVLSYAFAELGLYRIGAVTFPENKSSNRLLEKLGFTWEGRLRGYLHQRNQSHDAFIFSILRTEWMGEEKAEG